jgi:RND superfamily putative drug exporter
MFKYLGYWIAHRPVWLILAWVGLIAAGVTWALMAGPATPTDAGSFLPADHPLNQANRLAREAFPRLNSQSQIVLIAHRPAGLNPGDFDWMGHIGEIVERQMQRTVLSPAVAFLRHRLVSTDGQAAMLVVNLPNNFISAAAAQAVDQFDTIVAANPPPTGLTTEVTGTAGIGRDYAAATQQALHRTTWVTVLAVLAILIIVYRSPIGAFVPLISIGASVYVAFTVLRLLSRMGLAISTMEHIFSVVLIFGMGVDFALFWIARYREELQEASDFNASAITATKLAGPAIFVSAATTICGLTTMLITQLTPTQNAGKVLAIVLTVALVASLTLAPALARLLGRALFWPRGFAGQTSLGQEHIWPRIAAVVTRHPVATLVVGVLLLGIPALRATQLEARYDSLSELPPGSSSLRGFNIATEHFEKGQLYSNIILLEFADTTASVSELHKLSRTLAQRVAAVKGVHDVYSLDAPLGRARAGAMGELGATMAWLGSSMGESQTRPASPLAGIVGKLVPSQRIEEMAQLVRTYYLSDNPRILRFEVLIDTLPFSPEAMATMDHVTGVINAVMTEASPVEPQGHALDPSEPEVGHGQDSPWRAQARESASRTSPPSSELKKAGKDVRRPRVLQTGPTPYILAIRDISNHDQIRVRLFASLVIAVIVFTLIRDLPLTIFMLAATWLTYGATIAGTEWYFATFMHENGLDWKVHLIVFVIIVAVGQDYNIFLVSRLFQEPPHLPDAEAARRAIVRTGSVISNCGLIMAATLGSLCVGRLGLLRQVGFALALGILVDTFFVRPLLLPSFFLATHRRRRRRELLPANQADQKG